LTDTESGAQLLSVVEVGEWLHLHPQTVRRYMNTGALGFVRVGRYRMVSLDQLVAFITARRTDGDGNGDH